MPKSVAIDTFLDMLAKSHAGPIILSLHTCNCKLPGESGHTKFQKGNRSVPSPFTKGINHVLIQNVMLGASYGKMVNNQRMKEGLPDNFEAERLWNGKGVRDKYFPRFCVQHKDTLTRYLRFRPYSNNPAGIPTPALDEYRDARTNKLIPMDTLLQFYTPSTYQNASQGTDKLTAWQVIKLENIVSATYDEKTFFFTR